MVGPDGEQVGVVRIEDALRLANEADLDLVEVAPDARPPVCKLMDYGKFKYEAALKARDQRRNQANTQLKEIRLGLKIDDHDYATKRGHIQRFLDGGDKVKVMIRFKGREQSRPEAGIKLLQRLAEDVAEFGVVESAPHQDGRSMTMVLGPLKKKTDAMSAQRQRRADERQARRNAKQERAERNQAKVADLAAKASAAAPVAEEAPAPAAASTTPKPAPAQKPKAPRTKSASTKTSAAKASKPAAPAATKKAAEETQPKE